MTVVVDDLGDVAAAVASHDIVDLVLRAGRWDRPLSTSLRVW
jgi:hypothetical protein